MRPFGILARLFNGPSTGALAHAHEQAEIARLKDLNRDPPPGEGWRVAPRDSEGKWTVWKDARPIASFWAEHEAADMVVRLTGRAPETLDGEYCVNCGSHATDAALEARGKVSCCPERHVIPEVWKVTDSRLATGQWHVFRPADGLDTITDDGWDLRIGAQIEADQRNRAAEMLRLQSAPQSPDGVDALAYGLTAARLAQTDVRRWAAPDRYEEALARATVDHQRTVAGAPVQAPPPVGYDAKGAFLSVTLPDGVKAVVGPLRNPEDGKWYTFDRAGPMRGYSHRSDANRAAKRINDA